MERQLALIITMLVTSPVISDTESRVTSPVISDAESRVTSLVISDTESRVTSPVISDAESRVTSPVISDAESRVTSPVISDDKSRLPKQPHDSAHTANPHNSPKPRFSTTLPHVISDTDTDTFGPSYHINGPDEPNKHVEEPEFKGSVVEEGVMRRACPSGCSCTTNSVDCSYSGLTVIPKLPLQVQEVFLQGNKIENISCSSFQNLTRLRRLDLSSNFLKFLQPCAFRDLKQLANLTLSNCSIQKISGGTFAHLPSLYNLDLSNNQGIRFDQFEMVSKDFENTTLSILDISGISGLPSFDPLYLPMVHNTTFKHLKKTKLKTLCLDRNYLLYIHPAAIIDLPITIEDISLTDNQITGSLQWTAVALLTKLNLKRFNISKQFHQTDKYNKPITSFNSALLNKDIGRKLISNERFNFTIYKDIGHLPACFLAAENPEKDFCGSSEVWVTPLPKRLEVLDLSDIDYYGNIVRMQVCNNQVLRQLSFANNNAHCISGPFQGAPNLKLLDISGNLCFKLNPKAFEKLYSVTSLLLQDNFLGEALVKDTDGVIFWDMTGLQHLNLKNNDIKDLPTSIFLNTVNLKMLDLSYNSLWRFRPNLAMAKQLEVLDLSHNVLQSLSSDTCQQLDAIYLNSTGLKIYIRGNYFRCTCSNLHFLSLLLENPEIFGDLDQFFCVDDSGKRIVYEDLENFIPSCVKSCIAPYIFAFLLISFLVTLAGISLFALYHHKRWQWNYLFYVGKSRLHIGSVVVTYQPLAQVFLTFDQDSLECRHFVHTSFLPWLDQSRISYVLGEVDFSAGPLMPSIAGAVVSTHKTLVLFSSGMFDEDYHRALEVNLAIMHELQKGKPVLVPVILLRRWGDFAVNLGFEGRPTEQFHREVYVDDGEDGFNVQRGLSGENDNIFEELLEDFPPEISAYLIGQIHRCIFYDGGSEEFWNQLTNALVADV